jgi:hypothetical protein
VVEVFEVAEQLAGRGAAVDDSVFVDDELESGPPAAPPVAAR